jgi:hypothetical protein
LRVNHYPLRLRTLSAMGEIIARMAKARALTRSVLGSDQTPKKSRPLVAAGRHDLGFLVDYQK